MRGTLIAIAVLALVAPAGCRQDLPNAPATHATEALRLSRGRWMVRTELLFGLARGDGPDISDAEFRAFIDEVVSPRFPDGFTILEGHGQWRSAEDGQVRRERSRVILLVGALTADTDERIELVRRTYCERFGQESVLRVDSAARAGF
jgi:hypothetical protein